MIVNVCTGLRNWYYIYHSDDEGIITFEFDRICLLLIRDPPAVYAAFDK